MRVFFLQVPRTGGTSLHQIIERNYRPGEMYTVPTVPWETANFRSLRDEWSIEAKRKIKIVRGHMHYGWHHAFPLDEHDALYITILRDPVERIESLWRYVWGIDDHPLYPKKQTTVEQFVRDTANGMVKMLSGMPNIEGCEDWALEMAKVHLSKDFAVVGFTDRYQAFLDQLSSPFRWECEMVHINASDHTRTFEHEDLARFFNQYDTKLYEWAKETFGT